MARTRAPASPLRMDIVEEIRDRGPSSIAELAEALVRPKTSLYFHVHKLQEAGVVRGRKERKAARQVEAVYALVPQRARREARRSVARAELVARAGSAVLRRAERHHGVAAREGLSPVAVSKRLRLSAAEARELAAEVNKL